MSCLSCLGGAPRAVRRGRTGFDRSAGGGQTPPHGEGWGLGTPPTFPWRAPLPRGAFVFCLRLETLRLQSLESKKGTEEDGDDFQNVCHREGAACWKPPGTHTTNASGEGTEGLQGESLNDWNTVSVGAERR